MRKAPSARSNRVPVRIELRFIQRPGVTTDRSGRQTAAVFSRDTGFCTELCEGGDLRSALDHDVCESSSQHPRQLSWYIEGHHIALDAARGMHFLHTVCARYALCHCYMSFRTVSVSSQSCGRIPREATRSDPVLIDDHIIGIGILCHVFDRGPTLVCHDMDQTGNSTACHGTLNLKW